MARQIQNVLVAGPNGSLGWSVVQHLKDNDFNITLLTRSLEKTKSAFPGLNVIDANYDSVDDLTTSLRNEAGEQDALIILINRDEDQAQINLIDAAIAVGISHIIPSAFGESTTRSGMRDNPVLQAKARVEDYLIQKANEGRLTYTQVQTGSFLDWALSRGIYLNTKDPNAPTIVFDGGDVLYSATNMDDIGKSVAAVLLKVDQVRNKDVHVHTAVITPNQLLTYARAAAPDREFKVNHVDTREMEKQGFERYNSGDKSLETMRLFLPRLVFGKKLGLFEETDNDLLGVRQWTDDEVKEFVAGYLK